VGKLGVSAVCESISASTSGHLTKTGNVRLKHIIDQVQRLTSAILCMLSFIIIQVCMLDPQWHVFREWLRSGLHLSVDGIGAKNPNFDFSPSMSARLKGGVATDHGLRALEWSGKGIGMDIVWACCVVG
jgi:hypothetical protein